MFRKSLALLGDMRLSQGYRVPISFGSWDIARSFTPQALIRARYVMTRFGAETL